MRGYALALVLCAGVTQAQAQTTPEALHLLRKIHHATQKLSYTGTFVYQQGERTETSRIARIANASGGIERLEVLDGTPREIVRTGDTVRCYLPESETVKVEHIGDQRTFPALLPDRFTDLARHYVITLGERERVAGFDSESVLLTSRDELRYSHKLWADAASGMLLKARTLNVKGETVEQFTFTQLSIGSVPRSKVKSKFAGRNWRVDDASVAPANLAEAGWSVETDLPGFRKIGEVRRRVHESPEVRQVVYSDGMAAVSVFIEPLPGRHDPARNGLSSLGAINIFTREVANHLITVVGDAPAVSVRRVAERVEFRRKK